MSRPGIRASRVTVTPYAPGDMEELLARGLRASDAREIMKNTGRDAPEIVAVSIPLSSHVVTGRVDGRAVFLAGVAPKTILSDTGIPWLVAHDDFEDPRLAMVMARRVKRLVERGLTLYRRLENLADPEHEKALRLLAWAGFSFSAKPFTGPLGHKLVHFWR